MRVKSIVEVAALHRARPRPDQVDDGKESNVQRIIRRSAYYSALLANTLLALQKAYNQALTVETISRLLGRFQKSGLISVKGKYITVLDHVALGVMAGATRPACG